MEPSHDLSRILFVIAVILGTVIIGVLLSQGRDLHVSGTAMVSLLGASLCALIIAPRLPAINAHGIGQMLRYALIWLAIGLGIALLYSVFA